MSNLIDSLIALGIVAVFFFLIFMRLKSKHPEWGESISDYFPYLKNRKPESQKTDAITQQRWSRHQEMI